MGDTRGADVYVGFELNGKGAFFPFFFFFPVLVFLERLAGLQDDFWVWVVRGKATRDIRAERGQREETTTAERGTDGDGWWSRSVK